MRAAFTLLLASMVYAETLVLPSSSQAPTTPPPVPNGLRYVVTYLEVSPTAEIDAKKLVRQFRDLMRNETGNLRTEALQRVGQPNQLVLLEAWREQTAVDSHAQAYSTAQFHEQIKAIQNAPLRADPFPAFGRTSRRNSRCRNAGNRDSCRRDPSAA